MMMMTATTFWTTAMAATVFLSSFMTTSVVAQDEGQQCLSDPTLNEFFQTDTPTCCMFDVCGLPCPTEVTEPGNGE
jgi:hypothetical protein